MYLKTVHHNFQLKEVKEHECSCISFPLKWQFCGQELNTLLSATHLQLSYHDKNCDIIDSVIFCHVSTVKIQQRLLVLVNLGLVILNRW